LICSNAFGQKIQTILDGNKSDSSFYHLTKISDNEFWLGGKFGIISKKAGSDIFTIIIEYPDKRAVSKNRFFNFFNRS